MTSERSLRTLGICCGCSQVTSLALPRAAGLRPSGWDLGCGLIEVVVRTTDGCLPLSQGTCDPS